MDYYQHTPGSSVQAQQLLTRQVSLFLFDLKNEASEHGFKAGDSWTLQLATDQEFAGLKKLHFPIISLRLNPDTLLNVFQQVKGKLHQELSKQEEDLTVKDLIREGIATMAAYPYHPALK
ncbi:hypothetical protein HDF24_01120 [Mucilaginibacter sp. X4EP1]|jgi:hypothetical protein|uniref:hypothetical protein n=1 Tax=Mucilaginibacter sp. X4EP1 TaxID=2723092 RepID=UPI0021680770|nr:hypothetical protein [Mucilaginibacter sp. X4EP1]MCS3811616.1 hypothetical protein [Mucilaginibacter sp. X4EP1]